MDFRRVLFRSVRPPVGCPQRGSLQERLQPRVPGPAATVGKSSRLKPLLQKPAQAGSGRVNTEPPRPPRRPDTRARPPPARSARPNRPPRAFGASRLGGGAGLLGRRPRARAVSSEEHTSELQPPMRHSFAVFWLEIIIFHKT